MQRVLFARLEVWLVALLLIFAAVASIIFGAVALRAERAPNSVGRLERLALTIVETPLTVRELLLRRDRRLAVRTARLGGKGGWNVANGGTALNGEGYLLLSRYDGDIDAAVIELIDLADQSVRHRWTPDADVLFGGIERPSRPARNTDLWSRYYFEAYHPFLLKDGSLLVKGNGSPMARIDRCSRPLWIESSQVYHHSTERDADGNFWIPVYVQRPDHDLPASFIDDGLARVSPEGEVLEVISLVDTFIRNDLTNYVFDTGRDFGDPLHLNDIQPVLADGPHWKKGDLFLSMRHNSLIALYRPSTDEVVWTRAGPWLGQHDVDVLDGSRISIFNNNAINKGKGPEFAGASELMIYDFATDSIATPVSEALAGVGLRTHTEGLFERTRTGDLLFEEENSGRIVILSPSGDLLAEYVNRASSGEVFTTGWSRYISRDEGAETLASISSAASCPTPQDG